MNTICETLTYTQFGAIQLKKPATPESVSITVDERPLPIKAFDVYGAPILPKSVVQVLEQKEIIAKRKGYPLPEVKVTYTEQEIQSSRASTLQDQSYIESKLQTLQDFYAYISEVKIFKKAFPTFRGKNWILFGIYLLTDEGKLFELEFPYTNVANVINAKELSPNDQKLKTPFEVNIPSPVHKCPHCLKNFTLLDVIKGNFAEEGTWHKSCVDEVKNTEQMFNDSLIKF